MCFIILIIHPVITYGHFLFLKWEYFDIGKHGKEIDDNFFQWFFLKKLKILVILILMRIDLDVLVLHEYLLRFHFSHNYVSWINYVDNKKHWNEIQFFTETGARNYCKYLTC